MNLKRYTLKRYTIERYTLKRYSLQRYPHIYSHTRYISSVESALFPVTATQWHPEKATFEFNEKQRIPHQPAAVLLSQAIANMVIYMYVCVCVCVCVCVYVLYDIFVYVLCMCEHIHIPHLAIMVILFFCVCMIYLYMYFTFTHTHTHTHTAGRRPSCVGHSQFFFEIFVYSMCLGQFPVFPVFHVYLGQFLLVSFGHLLYVYIWRIVFAWILFKP